MTQTGKKLRCLLPQVQSDFCFAKAGKGMTADRELFLSPPTALLALLRQTTETPHFFPRGKSLSTVHQPAVASIFQTISPGPPLGIN